MWGTGEGFAEQLDSLRTRVQRPERWDIGGWGVSSWLSPLSSLSHPPLQYRGTDPLPTPTLRASPPHT